MATKASKLMAANKTVKERASKFETSIKRDIQKNVLDNLQTQIEGKEDEIFELEDFTLETNVNSGKSAITKEECQRRFERLIEIDFELSILRAELKVKQESFDKYFNS